MVGQGIVQGHQRIRLSFTDDHTRLKGHGKDTSGVLGEKWKKVLISACPDEWLAAPVAATIHAEAVPGLVCLGTHGGVCMYMQAAVKPGEHVCSFCGLVNGEFFGAGP